MAWTKRFMSADSGRSCKRRCCRGGRQCRDQSSIDRARLGRWRSFRKPGAEPRGSADGRGLIQPWPMSAFVRSVSTGAGQPTSLSHTNSHGFRRADHATLLDSVGTPLGAAQALLGHASSELTRDTYIGSVPVDAQRAVEGEEALIGPKWTQAPDWPELGSMLMNRYCGI